ncbi:SDR family oxidoreductase [Flavobacterium sp.]|uniref:SDR family oxidoreductase n=1 Tax=Flavobacterium sp. TaxID=239 RepID=UPI0008BD6EF3|nr:SDR family oxidoreductase [Flavobacterium sp.]OGS65489.1 MAG: NAD(P)-dependent oxidoreductase [Flavobacteria bacterium GWA2_35_26]HCF03612.1 NAD(P)-dependent oxidoreductase [Flavobacterium sp.]
MTQISILGCGWLGLPLAKSLLQNGFSIKGSTTSLEKISLLESEGITPFLVRLEEQQISASVADFLADSQILIINIPPKLRGGSTENFVAKITTLLPFIENSTVEKVLFVSSTSVYGEDNEFVSEVTVLNPDTEGGRQLAIVENVLQKNSRFQTTILRFGGLISDERNPVRFLSGRETIENPDAPINLIHQDDCIGIIEKIIALNSWDETYNAVAPFHPTRQEYYTQKATELNLALPKFAALNTIVGKTILNNKLIEVLEYSFIKPTL